MQGSATYRGVVTMEGWCIAVTRKDYELIAGAIARTNMAKTWKELNPSTVKREANAATLRLLVVDVAASLADDNPRFDRDRFIKATGVFG